jgi:hypothetical protein
MLSLAATLLASRPALAADSESATRGAARRLGTSGVEAFEAGDYKTASDKLERSYAALKVPSLGLWSARALIKLNRWVEASERLLEVTRLEVSGGDLAIQKAARSDAEAELAALSPHIPAVVIELKGVAAADIEVDGHAIAGSLVGAAIPIDPGSHTLRANNDGRVVEQTARFVADAQPAHVVLDFGDAPAPAKPSQRAPTSPVPHERPVASTNPSVDAMPHDSSRRSLALVVAGAGVVGLGAGTFFYFKARGNNEDAKGICRSNTDCAAADIRKHGELVDDVKTERTVSYVALGVGAAALVGGAVLYFTAPKPSPSGSAARLPLRFAVTPLPEGGYVGFVRGSL